MTDREKRIRRLLIDKGLMQKELAQMVGVTQSAMSHYVKGDRMPNVMTFGKIARVLGVSMEYLLIGDAAYKEEKHE